MSKFHLQIISPSQVIFSHDVAMAIIPGAAGNFGVLPKHENLIAHSKAGIVEVRQSNRNHTSARFIISAGIVQVTANGCSVLVNFAITLEKCYTPEAVLTKIKNAEEELLKTPELYKKESLQEEIDYLKVMFEVCS
jgi:F-type H+-transporting ATPase subunit epsilon